MHELHITLRSDASFGRGDGVAGLVDQEIEYDIRTGLPFIRGRTLKGLLVEECANILYGLAASPALAEMQESAQFLFGDPGSTLNGQSHLQVGRAMMPEDLQQAVTYAIKKKRAVIASEILDTLTTIRRQTAVNDESGTPDDGSLRATRMLIRKTHLVAELDFDQELPEESKERTLALLAACVAGLRRGGSNRNRGAGRLRAVLDSEDDMNAKLKTFAAMVTGGAS